MKIEFCLLWNVDYSAVITHSALHQASFEVSSFVLLENRTAAVPSWPAQPTSPKEVEG